MKLKKLLSTVLLGTMLFSNLVFANDFTSKMSKKEYDYYMNLTKEERQAYDYMANQNEKLKDEWNKYKVDESRVKNNLRNKRSLDNNYGLGMNGDILVSSDSITGHAAMVVDKYYTVEANANWHDTHPGVAIWNNIWKKRYKSMKGLRLKEVTKKQKQDAMDYCKAQVGEPYNIPRPGIIWDDDAWYCSQLVWRAYHEQGIDIVKANSNLSIVTPRELVKSPEVYVFYSEGWGFWDDVLPFR